MRIIVHMVPIIVHNMLIRAQYCAYFCTYYAYYCRIMPINAHYYAYDC